MKIKPFTLERYFAEHEFSVPYLLSCSDCEPLSMQELLSMADEEVLKLWNNLILSYTESHGHPLLRQEIAGLYKNTTMKDILTVVPEEGIFIAMNTLLEQGDTIITTFPGYQSLYEIARSIGCTVKTWAPRQETCFHFSVDDIAKQIDSQTKMLVINFPHNPTGQTITHNDLNRLVELAEKHNIYIFSDEMYRLLEYTPTLRLDAVCDLYENAISLSGMSKTFALPGLRSGWLATRNKTIYDQLCTYKDYTTICANAPGEILSIIGLRNRDRIINRNLTIIRKNLTVLDDFFRRHPDTFTPNTPIAGSVMFPKMLKGPSMQEICKGLISQKGLMVLAGGMFDFDDNYFRIGQARKDMPVALGKFEEYLIELKLV